MPGDSQFAVPCVENLLHFDENGLLVPWLATAWKISPDLKSITFTLRKGVKFHDGTDLNAEAVKYLLDLYRTGVRPDLRAVASIDVVDNYTVQINLSRFEGQLLGNFALQPGRMVSPTALKTQGKQWCLTHPVGTGPFKFASFQRDVSLKYERFDGYWQKGKPYLDAIEFDFIADRVTATMAFKSGKGHVLNSIDAKTAAELEGMGKYTITKTPSAVTGLAGDGGNPKSPFADVRVRRALSYALDREEIAKAMGYGFFRAADQPAAPGSRFYNSAVVGYPYNPQKAKELLIQAGYPNGFKTRIMFQTNAPLRDMFTAAQAYLGQIGIEAKLEPQTPSLFTQTSTSGWENGLVSQSVQAGVGTDLAGSFLSFLSNRADQYASIIHPTDYEAKLSLTLTEANPDKRKVLIQELIKMIIDEYCMVTPVYVSYGIAAQSSQVHDLRMLEHWYQQWTPQDTWLSK